MKRLFLVSLFILLSFSQTLFANDYYCQKWGKAPSITCTFAGRNADVWERQCENPCSYQNYNPTCDVERICLNEDPNQLVTACSAWRKESSMTCLNRSTARWEQKWVRACQKGLATTWCSDEYPNF